MRNGPSTLVDAGTAVIGAGIVQLEQSSDPNPVAAHALLRLARQLELDTDR
jgi:hypothetical protein